MKKLLLFGMLASMLFSCDSESPDTPISPEPPIETGIKLTLLPTIENLTEAATRGVVTGFKPGDRIGIFYNDTCINSKFTYSGTSWSGENILLSSTMKNMYCYFPYDITVKSHDNIPINIEDQTDFLNGSTIVGTSNADAEVVMKHTLALVRVVLKKNNYTGNAKVESVIWNGIYKQAKFNAVANTITTTGEKGDYQAGGNFTVNDNEEPIIVEAILLPISTAEGVSVTITVDGEARVYQLPKNHQWEAGKTYTYTLTLKGGYNSPIELEEYPIDIAHWSTFGKTDKIVLSQSDKDWFDIEPGSIPYGSNIYRNEGYMFGFYGYWTGFDMETGNMPEKWEGDFRMVLLDDNGNIVDQYQPCAIVAENGAMMKGTGRRCYVTAPAGTYELSVLFRKRGETTWQKANRKDNATKKDMTFTIQDPTDLPSLRMVQVEEEVNTGVVIHNRPFDSEFNITYILSNRNDIRLKGEIKAVWERTFDYTGHCYRPASKKKNTINDIEWQDEIGRISIDLQPTVRFWKGIIPCSFRVKREMPKMANGIGYCTPMVHLYWKPEGGSEWTLLRLDMDPILAAKVNNSQEEANLFLEALNYLNFEQTHWHQ